MDRAHSVLILYASAGHGHEKAARAIEEVVRPRHDSVRCLDVLELSPGPFGRMYRGTYLFLIQHMPWLWGWLYYLADAPFLYPFLRPLRRAVNAFAGRRLERIVIDGGFDTVIATHFFPTEVVSRMKRDGRTRARLITVITDFLPHFFWVAEHVDLYAVAAEGTRAELLRRGVRPERITITGIPIGKAFRVLPSREDARAYLEIEPSAFVVLLTSGGAGVGSMETLAAAILRQGGPYTILAVCGTNRTLLARLELLELREPSLLPMGFVENMHELMSAADVVVGKAGGLTVSESLAAGRPLILIRPVPGQESRNAACVSAAGAARVVSGVDEAVRAIGRLLEDPASLEALKAAAARVGKLDAAERVAGMIHGA